MKSTRNQNLPVELAHKALMSRPAGLPPAQLARAAMKLKGSVPLSLATALLRQALGMDERFVELENGSWALKDRGKTTPLSNTVFTVIDTETTGGLSPYSRVIEVAAFHVKDGRVQESFMSLVNPEREIPPEISLLTGIYDEHVADAPKFPEIAKGISQFIGDTVFVAHSAQFDFKFLNLEFVRAGFEPMRNDVVCTVRLARRLFRDLPSRELGALSAHLGIDLREERHRAHGDAWATALAMVRFLEMLDERGVHTLEALMRFQATPPGRLAAKSSEPKNPAK